MAASACKQTRMDMQSLGRGTKCVTLCYHTPIPQCYSSHCLPLYFPYISWLRVPSQVPALPQPWNVLTYSLEQRLLVPFESRFPTKSLISQHFANYTVIPKTAVPPCVLKGLIIQVDVAHILSPRGMLPACSLTLIPTCSLTLVPACSLTPPIVTRGENKQTNVHCA